VVILRDQAEEHPLHQVWVYTPRCSGRIQPDVTILTLNPTIAPVGTRSKWGLGLGIGLGDQTMKLAQLGRPADDIRLAQKI